MKRISVFLILILILILFIPISSASILTSSANPTSIFKCGESTISATFNDAGITSVSAVLNPIKSVSPMIPGSGRVALETAPTVIVPLTWNGTFWVGTFGDDTNMLWGTRSISYNVSNGVISTTYLSSSTIFVYNNLPCTGTGKNSYQNYSIGIGTYTNKLAQTDMDLLSWAIFPWLEYWGVLLYVIVIFVTVSAIYMKTQNVMPILYTVIIFLLVISAGGYIPLAFRQPILALIALGLGAVFYRIFTRE